MGHVDQDRRERTPVTPSPTVAQGLFHLGGLCPAITVAVDTDESIDVVDVTERVRNEIPPETKGVCTVFVRHTTAGLVLQEAEDRLLADIAELAEGLVADEGWRHDRLDGNADAHLRATLLGSDLSVPVRDGDLALGSWQSILLVECDGPRTRTVTVTTVAEP